VIRLVGDDHYWYFSLPYRLRRAVRRFQMRFVFTVLLLSSLAACAGHAGQQPASPGSDFMPDSRPVARTMVYECDDIDFVTRLGPGEMALWLEDRYTVLPQVRSASGSKYQEGDIVFWSRGDEAMLEIAGRTYRNCRLNPARAPWEDARRRGVDFRATGNEPGWHLEVRGSESLLFVGDYGASKMLFRDVQRNEDGEQVFYTARSESRDLTVTVTESDCTDTMKGDTFPYAVVVQINERSYQGCGRELDHPWE